VFTPQEREYDWPQDQPQQLDRVTEIDETTQLSPVELEVESNSVVGTVDQVAPVNVSTTEKEIISERSSTDNNVQVNSCSLVP
jgi:hypothetical protein